MATFEAKVYRLAIEPHPNADKLELARVGDYRSIVQKGLYKTGDLGVYIPEQAVLPEWIINRLELEGKLAGKQKNRVKAIKLRGILSQGLIYPFEKETINGETKNVLYYQHQAAPGPYLHQKYNLEEGSDVTELLGIVKYEPPIPVHMAGEIYNAGRNILFPYDIENIKKYPDIFTDGQMVVFTEKLHGSFMIFVQLPCSMHDEKHYQGKFIVSSKGLAARGLALKHNEANANNIYLRAAEQHDLYRKFENIANTHNAPVYILGEVFGPGIQDLQYGIAQNEPIGFRVFDIRIGTNWMPAFNLTYQCSLWGLEPVPELYRGHFSKKVMEEYTNGRETVSGKQLHVREGIVIRPYMEQTDEELGRVILKNVSEHYLLRKGGTEYN